MSSEATSDGLVLSTALKSMNGAWQSSLIELVEPTLVAVLDP
jgi:hypothetical protein